MKLGIGLGIARVRKIGPSAASGITHLYMDGATSLLRSPQATITRVVIDFAYLDNPTSTNGYYLMDNRGGTPSANCQISVNNNAINKQAGWVAMKLDGVEGIAFTGLTAGTRYVIDATSAATLTDANGLEFGVNYINQAITRFKGRFYRITAYNGETVVFDYDMSTGTAQDQSGNGRHATVTAGTFV